MDNGKVLEQGEHASLMSNEQYATLINTFLSENQVAGKADENVDDVDNETLARQVNNEK